MIFKRKTFLFSSSSRVCSYLVRDPRERWEGERERRREGDWKGGREKKEKGVRKGGNEMRREGRSEGKRRGGKKGRVGRKGEQKGERRKSG